ncbi:MAG: CBS domain-containing protein [Nitrospiria bacterium]
MKCQDVMTRHPKSILASSTAKQAAQLMKSANVGFLPVTDEKTNKLIGVLTDRDLCMGIVAEGKIPGGVKVGALMTPRAIFCHPTDDVHNAETLMKAYQVRRVAVVDQMGNCVGVISEADIALKVPQAQEVYETVREISKPRAMAFA